MFNSDAERTAETARLNDSARTDPARIKATWHATRGVAELIADAEGRAEELRHALASFSDFEPGNDPYGERDFGAFSLWGERLLWKIDYYHPEREEHSPVTWSAELTRRVLTIMLASEY